MGVARSFVRDPLPDLLCCLFHLHASPTGLSSRGRHCQRHVVTACARSDGISDHFLEGMRAVLGVPPQRVLLGPRPRLLVPILAVFGVCSHACSREHKGNCDSRPHPEATHVAEEARACAEKRRRTEAKEAVPLESRGEAEHGQTRAALRNSQQRRPALALASVRDKVLRFFLSILFFNRPG